MLRLRILVETLRGMHGIRANDQTRAKWDRTTYQEKYKEVEDEVLFLGGFQSREEVRRVPFPRDSTSFCSSAVRESVCLP